MWLEAILLGAGCGCLHPSYGPSHDGGCSYCSSGCGPARATLQAHCRELMPVSRYQRSLGTSPRPYRLSPSPQLLPTSPREFRLLPDIVRQSVIDQNPPPLDYTRFPLKSDAARSDGRSGGVRCSQQLIAPFVWLHGQFQNLDRQSVASEAAEFQAHPDNRGQ